MAEIARLPTGKAENADRKFEDAAAQLLASMLYPHLDFAAVQSRTDSGVNIRDLVFYNNRAHPFLRDVFDEFESRQLVMELKNVLAVEREHLNQLNRYMAAEFGRFGVIVTRNELPKTAWRNTIDLWSGQRRCIIALTQPDIAQMVELFQSKQRLPLDVVNKKYREFRRACPS
jgi:DNA topoisomerase VI subunit A